MTLLAFTFLALAASILFYAVTRPAVSSRFLIQADKDILMTTIVEAATAIEGAAGSLTTAAQGLTSATDAIKALVASGDTSSLDKPLADLATATQAVSDAGAAIQTALNPPAPAAQVPAEAQ